MLTLHSFDFDGTLSSDSSIQSLYSKLVTDKEFVCILTGRCLDESYIVNDKLSQFGLYSPRVPVYFNPAPLEVRGNYNEGSRKSSGYHKLAMIKQFLKYYDRVFHYDDDPLQLNIVKYGLTFPDEHERVVLREVDGNGSYYAK